MTRSAKQVRWEVGVTTVPERLDNLLPSTLHSLKAAGFDGPRLFVDGIDSGRLREAESRFCGLPLSSRNPRVGTFGNWHLGMLELFIRNPHADRYAMFQDDVVAVGNLKTYLDRHLMPEDGYWNLYSFPENEVLARGVKGWHRSNQRGKGALGLAFSNKVVRLLLSTQTMIDKPMHQTRGKTNLDGAIVTALERHKVHELCHFPSLIGHLGDVSTVRVGQPIPESWCSRSFPGEEFDALTL